ncbi:hypothetical protein QWV57_10515 [Geobacillus zalihae]|uniref:hypothetical protein n=1 Tax=Geobacillus TaxID=129337 RepID=UPI0003FA30F9|nr:MULTISPECIES: hypothetical protein [Geobacillus]OQP17045.1 hypothetical protein B1693_05500 [Geobacillus zalihae]RXS89908.1 hypothetical protein ETR37_05450 [Geobacillus sp. PK12]WKA46137.1 hypothetical protein QWV57_10515 [Geobacillus zalihae]
MTHDRIQDWIGMWRVPVYTAAVALYMVAQFVETAPVHYAMGAAALSAFIVSAFFARGVYQVSGALFFAFGVGLFLFYGDAWPTFVLHFERVLGLLALFFVLPFMNTLIRVGRYDQSLSEWLKRNVGGVSSLYRRSFSVCHLLGLFLNIATIPLLVKSLRTALRNVGGRKAESFYVRNLLRAYALCLTWSPMEVMISTTIDFTGVHYYEVALFLLLLAFTMAMIDWGTAAVSYRSIPLDNGEEAGRESAVSIGKKAAQLLVVLVVFTVLVSLVQRWLGKGFLFSIVLLLVPFCFGWALLVRRVKRYAVMALCHWKERTEGLGNYFFMFLGAGLFVEMLARSPLLAGLGGWFRVGAEHSVWLYAMIAAYFFTTSLVGFHPLVSLTLLMPLLEPVRLLVPAVPLSIVLICCSLATVMYSPYNISVSLLAEELGDNPYRIGRRNVPFALGYMAVGIGIALLAERLFFG